MTKNLKKLSEIVKEQFGERANTEDLLVWLLEKDIISHTSVRDYNIIYDYIQLKEQNPDSSKNDRIYHLEVSYGLTFSPIYRKVKDL